METPALSWYLLERPASTAGQSSDPGSSRWSCSPEPVECSGQMKGTAFIEPPQGAIIETIPRHCRLWYPSRPRAATVADVGAVRTSRGVGVRRAHGYASKEHRDCSTRSRKASSFLCRRTFFNARSWGSCCSMTGYWDSRKAATMIGNGLGTLWLPNCAQCWFQCSSAHDNHNGW